MSHFVSVRNMAATMVCCLVFVLAACQEQPAEPVSAPATIEPVGQLSEVVERPLTDFTQYQFATYWYDSENPLYAIYSDYTGLYNDAYGLNLGTTFKGYIHEQALDDGTARVTVSLHGTNVLTWVRLLNSPYSPIFGKNPAEVAGGATPALGECSLTWTFINPAPGAPIPYFASRGRLTFEAKAFGELREAAGLGPDGTRGMAWTSQVGLIEGAKPNDALDDGFPAEFVKVVRLQARMVGKN